MLTPCNKVCYNQIIIKKEVITLIDVNNIIFKEKSMTIEERVLYAFLLNERAYKQEQVRYGIVKEKDAIEEGFYYTIHSNQELMELLGCSKSKLIRIKKKLEDNGLLIQKRTLDGSNKYFTFNKEVK